MKGTRKRKKKSEKKKKTKKNDKEIVITHPPTHPAKEKKHDAPLYIYIYKYKCIKIIFVLFLRFTPKLLCTYF